jgi:hypothetical protein
MIAVTSFAHLNLLKDLVICIVAASAVVSTLIDGQVGALACAAVPRPEAAPDDSRAAAGAIFAAQAVTTAAIQSDSSMTTAESRRGIWKGSNARRIGPLLAQFGCYLFVWF